MDGSIMSLDRRQFLKRVALAAGGVALPAEAIAAANSPAANSLAVATDWEAVRQLFSISSRIIDMSAMLIAAHPQPVRLAIARYRDALDVDPVGFLEDNDGRLTDAVVAQAAAYLATTPRAIALTDSTTQGVGLAYNGIRLKPGDEILTTDQDYYVTHETLRLVAARSGAVLRKIRLYDDLAAVTPSALVQTVISAIRPQTRLVALTWVHSSTGLKLPVGEIGKRIAGLNEVREPGREILLGIDGVHGFGVEDVSFAELGCDFLMAGCHKWLFGPRGTGIIAASGRGWLASLPTVPTFLDSNVFQAWLTGKDPDPVPDGATMTPGGFKSYEHRWALAEAFRLHRDIGKDRVAARTHGLALMLKKGLAAMAHVVVITPLDPGLSSGIVSFDVRGYGAREVVRALRERGIIASAAPYATTHVRLTPSIRNNEADVEAALAAVAALAS